VDGVPDRWTGTKDPKDRGEAASGDGRSSSEAYLLFVTDRDRPPPTRSLAHYRVSILCTEQITLSMHAWHFSEYFVWNSSTGTALTFTVTYPRH
jgi:hypothetical protein